MKTLSILVILSVIFFACSGEETPRRGDNSSGPVAEFLSVGDRKIDPNNIPNDPIPINYGDMVTGTTSNIPEDMHLWLVVYSTKVGLYYPQQSEIIPSENNEWGLDVYVGTPDAGVGEQFDLLLVFVDEEGNQKFQDYLDTAAQSEEYPGMNLPDGYEEMDRITVVRASYFLSVGGHEIDPNDPIGGPIEIDNYVVGVTGTILFIPEDMHLWLVVYPIGSGRYHPQQSEIIPSENNEWRLDVYFGTPDAGVGEQFDLLLVFVNEEGNQALQDYLNNAAITGEYPGMDLPSGCEIIDRITVERTE
jgi:hypothetical protein